MQYHLISLEISNFKKIEAAGVVFHDGLTMVTGKNGSGKSSLLDAVFEALGAASVERPINKDHDRAVIELRLGGDEVAYTIEKKITATQKYLSVRDQDGKKINSPQAFLNALFTNCIDPEEFLRMKKADRCKQLRIACNCDTTLIEAEHKAKYEQRTEVNRMLLQQEETLKSLGEIKDVPIVESVGELSNERLALTKIGAEFDSYMSEANAMKKNYETALALRDEITAQIAALQQRLAETSADLETASAKLEVSRSQYKEKAAIAKAAQSRSHEIDALMQSIDASSLAANTISVTNGRIEEAAKLRNKFMAESVALSDKMADIDKTKKEMLELADYPVQGMYVEGDEIYVDDVPFAEINTANRIAIAMHVAMSQNPKLKLVFIRNGSMLDEESIDTVKKLAIEKGFQIIMEKVSASPDGDCGIHIVEGKTV